MFSGWKIVVSRTHTCCAELCCAVRNCQACQRTYCSQCALIDWYVECGNIAGQTQAALSAAIRPLETFAAPRKTKENAKGQWQRQWQWQRVLCSSWHCRVFGGSLLDNPETINLHFPAGLSRSRPQRQSLTRAASCGCVGGSQPGSWFLGFRWFRGSPRVKW